MTFEHAMTLAGFLLAAVTGLAGIAVYLERKTIAVFDARFGQFDLKLDAVHTNQEAAASAALDVANRVQRLEVTVNNGLTHRTEQTADDVATIKECQQKMLTQLAEVHGWIKARERL